MRIISNEDELLSRYFLSTSWWLLITANYITTYWQYSRVSTCFDTVRWSDENFCGIKIVFSCNWLRDSICKWGCTCECIGVRYVVILFVLYYKLYNTNCYFVCLLWYVNVCISTWYLSPILSRVKISSLTHLKTLKKGTTVDYRRNWFSSGYLEWWYLIRKFMYHL